MSHTEISGPGEGPYGVAVAAGEVWTTLVHAGAVVRAAGQRYDLGAPASRPMVITAGTGGVWFTRNGDDHVGHIDAAGNISAIAVAGAPYGICVGPDNALWCTLMSTDQVARITADGEVTTYPIGVAGGFPAMITGSDELWFTLNQGNAIGRMTTAGEVTTYPLPTSGAGPVGISAGPEAVWFVELQADQAGRISADGTIEEFPLPAGSKPHAVVATADGGCWITLWGSGSLARMDVGGAVVEVIELGEGSEPHGLAVDTDGSVWVALENGSLAHIHAGE
ncbi:virginiamycin B lyase [Kribbella albertanoniae]|uniref:Virginiamycin B lyase n=1 Tax=Kribbella albertanoniae TaxID=1266829 RepID=A0A4R4PM50_9ACTN|nr:virginiamycin B lyase [Kribbella albertanoniae]TDC23231.1 virginiamycin B lyase [Kribbella albertanoniae]